MKKIIKEQKEKLQIKLSVISIEVDGRTSVYFRDERVGELKVSRSAASLLLDKLEQTVEEENK